MEISLKRSYQYCTLVVTDTNVNIEEDLTEGLYTLKEDGKKDFNKRLGYDVTDVGLDLLVKPLEDLAYYREREYDSSALIATLFDKLPEDKQTALLSYIQEQLR